MTLQKIILSFIIFLSFTTSVLATDIQSAQKLFNEGVELIQSSLYESAIDRLESALEIYKKLKDTDGVGRCCIAIGICYDIIGEYEIALKYYKGSSIIFEKIENRNLLALSFDKIGLLLLSLDYRSEVLEYFRKSLQIYESVKDTFGLSASLDNIGFFYFYIEDYDKAMEYYNRSLKLRELMGDKTELAKSYNNIGWTYYSMGDYDNALDCFQRNIKIFEETRNEMEIVKSYKNIGKIYETIEYYDSALEYYQSAEKIQKLHKDIPALAQTYMDIGKVYDSRARAYNSKKDYFTALTYFQKSSILLRKLEDKGELAKSYNNIGWIYYSIGDYKKSIKHFEKCLDIYISLEDKDGIVKSYYDIIDVYNAKGNSNEAMKYFNKILFVYDILKDPRGMAKVFYNIGMMYKSNEDYPKSLDYLNKSLSIYEVLNDSLELAEIYYAICKIYYSKFDFNNAMRYFEKAKLYGSTRSIYTSQDDYDKAPLYFRRVAEIQDSLGNKKKLAEAYNEIGSIYIYLGSYNKAMEYSLKAKEIQISIKDKIGLASTYSNIGDIYYYRETNTKSADYDTATQYYQKGLDICKALKDTTSKLAARSYSNVGWMYYEMDKDYDKAMEYYQISLRIYKSLKAKRELAEIYNYIGLLYEDKGDYDSALRNYLQSKSIKKSINDNTDIETLLGNIARLYKTQNKLKEALYYYNEAIKIIESTRGKFKGEEEIKTSFFAQYLYIYEGIIQTLIALNRSDLAYWYVERGKARSFLDMLEEGKANIEEGIPPELKKKKELLEVEFSQINAKLNEEQSKPKAEQNQSKIDELEKKLRKNEKQYDDLKSEIKRLNPKYAEISYPEPLTLQEIQNTIITDDNTVILEYFVGNENTYLWAITKNDYKTYTLPSKDELIDLIRNKETRGVLNVVIGDGTSKNKKYIKEFSVKSYRLYKILIEPAEKFIRQKYPKKFNNKNEDILNLLIIPDGIICYIPFELLVTREVTTPIELLNYKDLPYLINRYSVRYVQSATVMASLIKKGNIDTKMDLLAFGNPYIATTEKGGVRGEPSSSDIDKEIRAGFSQLPFAENEVKEIRKLFPDTTKTKIFTYKQATEDTLKSKAVAIDSYRIIHFATHGMLNEDKPDLSGLLLSQDLDYRQDGILYTREIFGLKINADMVVLSACQTGLGKNVSGEGVIGLTRAFMYAGSSSVIVSLWKVADESTSKLMVKFYSNINKSKMNKIDAFRKAKLDMINESDGKFASPYYWSPFILVGK